MRIPPLYVCPDCEGNGTYMYAGRIIMKRCSECSDARRNALTGADRERSFRRRGIDPAIRKLFMGSILALALAACAPDRTRLPDEFTGIPEGSQPSCAWNRINNARGECIVDGTRLRCYREQRSNHEHYWTAISCAPYKIIR